MASGEMATFFGHVGTQKWSVAIELAGELESSLGKVDENIIDVRSTRWIGIVGGGERRLEWRAICGNGCSRFPPLAELDGVRCGRFHRRNVRVHSFPDVCASCPCADRRCLAVGLAVNKRTIRNETRMRAFRCSEQYPTSRFLNSTRPSNRETKRFLLNHERFIQIA